MELFFKAVEKFRLKPLSGKGKYLEMKKFLFFELIDCRPGRTTAGTGRFISRPVSINRHEPSSGRVANRREIPVGIA